MNIPDKFKEILQKDQSLHSLVLDVVHDNSFGRILKDNKLFFFEEYTEHGIEHIEMVLKASEFLIPDESFEYIQPKEVAILILAIVLHDIGMHTEFSTFKAMIDGKYDDVRVDVLDKKTWQELWQDYLSEVKHWSSKQLEKVFGKPENENEVGVITIIKDVKNAIKNNKKDKLDGSHKKLIGEFIRKHHARLAHEIALKGLIGNETIPFGNENLSEQDRQFADIVARSHGMNIRKTFDYLKEIAYGVWKNPADMNIVFLMVLLRIADYFQIDKTRTDPNLLKLKTFKSPLSLKEHKTHLAISHLTFKNDDPELISVTAEPKDAQMYVKIQNLIKDIQQEFDLSWAILGETYGFLPKEKPEIKFRRISSNLKYPTFLQKINYVPKKIAFEVNSELSKLLVAPLYGDNPTYGVRELVQNATDACKERMKIEQDKKNTNYEPLVTVSIDKIDEEKYLFKIKDNGKGMTLDEIQNYFLSVGSSFRQTVEWKKEFEGNVSRNGRFGIGVLAAFLLGDKVAVKTKSYKNDEPAYEFTTDLSVNFIDVKKLSDFEIGTEIEIVMSKYLFYKLTDKKNRISWTDWYVGKLPRVQYLLNGNNQTPQWSYTPSRSFTPHNKEYGIVRWKYLKEWQNKSNILLVCNDIIITLSYPDCRFTIDDGTLAPGNHIIIDKPSIFMEDTQGVLPLRLDRNDLDIDRLPFENDLLLDVSKDFIAQLLMAQISMNTFITPIFSPHKTEFLHLANGFIFDCDYFINKLGGQYKFWGIKMDNGESILKYISMILSDFSEYVLIPYSFRAIEDICMSGREGIRLFRKDYQISRKKDYFYSESNYESSFSKIYDYFKKENRNFSDKIEWENDKYFIVNNKSNQTKTDKSTINNLLSIIEKLDNKIIAIEEIPLKDLLQRSLKGGVILGNLFEEYFGKNFIIPYNMKERKALYQRAFEELKDYMKDYEKQ